MDLLETIFNAIFDAEEEHGADNISITLNEQLSIVYNNSRIINSFDIKDLASSDVKRINDLCDYLELKVIGA